MSNERSTWHWRHLSVGLFCLLLVIYVAGYYALARHPTIAVPSFEGEPVEHIREYPLSIIRRAYAPIAWIDAHITHRRVFLETPDDEKSTDRIIIEP